MIIIYKPETTVQKLSTTRKQKHLQTFDDFSIYENNVSRHGTKEFQDELGDLEKFDLTKTHCFKLPSMELIWFMMSLLGRATEL